MKVTCKRAELLDKMQGVTSIVQARSPRPILQSFKIAAKGKEMELQATDLEVSLQQIITGVEVKKEGSVVVPAHHFHSILRETPAEVLELDVSENKLRLRAGGSRFTLLTQALDEFPKLPELNEKDKVIKLPRAELLEMLRRTAFAASRETSRYAINGILLNIEDRKWEMVATDGKRLAHASRRLKSGAGNQTAIILLKLASELERFLEKEKQEEISLAFRPNHILCRGADSLLTGRLVEGSFPKYQEVIPSDCNLEVRLKKEPFAGALRQAAILTSEETRSVTLSLKENHLTIDAHTPERGDAAIEMEAKYSGPQMEVSFNPQYIAEVLRVLASEEVVLGLKDGSRPGIIREATSTSAGMEYLCVIMPIRIPGPS